MFWLYSLQGLNYLIPLAVLPYLVRVLGVERYGLVAFAQAFAQYFTILTDYGFNLSSTKQISRLREDQNQISRIFSCVLFIKLVFLLMGGVILLFLVAFVPRFSHDANLYLIAYVAVLGNVLFPIWLFQGMEQMRYISIVSGGAKFLSAALLFLLVHQRSDYFLALSIQSGGFLIAGITGLCWAIKRFNIDFQIPPKAEIFKHLRDGWHLFVSNAAGTLYATANVFLVGLLAGNTEAGYYSAAEKIVRGIQGMLGPITQAVYPHVTGLAARSRESALLFIRKSMLLMAVLSFVPSFLLLAFSRPVAFVLFGSAAVGSIAPLRWISMLPFVIGVSSVLAVQTMIPFGLEKQLSRIYVLAAIGSLLFCVPLIFRYGAVGAGAGVLVLEIAIVFAMWAVLKRHRISLRLRANHSRIQHGPCDPESFETQARVAAGYEKL